MRIDDNYSIESDSTSCTLYRHHIVSKEGAKNLGKEIKDVVGYYHTVQGCLKRYLNEKLKECTDIDEIADKVTHALNVIRQAEEEIG